jgi:hypothetical protein
MPKKKTNFAQMIVRELRAPEPDSHFYHCAKCRQRKDMRELRDVFFHETDHSRIHVSPGSSENASKRGDGKFHHSLKSPLARASRITLPASSVNADHSGV